MKPSHQQQNDFLARKPISGVALQHNDYVRVVSGPYAPDAGSIVSIEALGVDPIYLIKLESGVDQLVAQSSLEFVSHD